MVVISPLVVTLPSSHAQSVYGYKRSSTLVIRDRFLRGDCRVINRHAIAAAPTPAMTPIQRPQRMPYDLLILFSLEVSAGPGIVIPG